MPMIKTLAMCLCFSLSARHCLAVGAPEILSPAQGAIRQETTVILDWGPVTGGVTGYEVGLRRVDNSNTLLESILTAHFVDGWARTSYDPPDLQLGQRYGWRVRATTSSGDGPFSAMTYFTTKIGEIDITAPSPGATGRTITPTFQWVKKTGITRYQIRIREGVAPDDSTPVLELNAPGSSYNQAVYGTQFHAPLIGATLSYSTRYFFQIRGITDYVNGAWGDAVEFSTEANTSGGPAATGLVFYPGASSFGVCGVVSQPATFDNARSFASNQAFPGAGGTYPVPPNNILKGHLATPGMVSSYLGMAGLAALTGTSAFLGLADDPALASGASNQGNTSALPIPANGAVAANGQRGAGFRFIDGSPFNVHHMPGNTSQSIWTTGEPNNSGSTTSNTEDVAELFGIMVMNDITSAASRPYLIEWDTAALADRPRLTWLSPVAGTWAIREFRKQGLVLDSLGKFTAFAHLADQGKMNPYAPTSGYRTRLALTDPEGATSLFTEPAEAYVSSTAGNDDNFGLYGIGLVRVPAGKGGEWKFKIRGDDGIGFRIKGKAPWTIESSAFNRAYAAWDGVYSDATTSDASITASVQLTPGAHEFEVIQFENTGSAFLEISAKGPGDSAYAVIGSPSGLQLEGANPPTVTSPASGTANIAPTVQFTWAFTGATPSGYEVQLLDNAGAVLTTATRPATATMTLTDFPGYQFELGKTYQFRVRAVLTAGTQYSSWSNPSTFTMTAGRPAASDQISVGGRPFRREYMVNLDGVTVQAFYTGGLSDAHPWLVDLDGDADLDLVVGGANDRLVYLTNWGSVSNSVWGRPREFTSRYSNGSDVIAVPALTDLNGDLRPDLVLSASVLPGYARNTFPVISYHLNSDQQYGLGYTTFDFFTPTLPGGPIYRHIQFLPSSGAPDLLVNGYRFPAAPGGGWQTTPNPVNARYAPVDTPCISQFYGIQSSGPDCIHVENGILRLLENTGTQANPIWNSNLVFQSDGVVFAQGQVSAHVFQTASRLTHGDLDGDGDFDLVAGDADGRLFLLENVGTSVMPFFAARPALDAFEMNDIDSLVAEDVDGDGDVDVALFPNSEDSGVLLRNVSSPLNPIWRSERWSLPSAGVRCLDLGDVNGDGRPDFVGYDPVSARVFWLEQLGTGSWGPTNLIAGVSTNYMGSGRPLVLSDLDRDGKRDLVFVGPGPSLLWAARNGNATGQLWNTQAQFLADLPRLLPPFSLALLDSPLDPNPDVLFSGSSSTSGIPDSLDVVYALANRGAGNNPLFADPPVLQSGFASADLRGILLESADVDSDTYPDLLYATQDGGLGFYRNADEVLPVSPPYQQVLAGRQGRFAVSGREPQSLQWSFLENRSGGSISNGWYQAGVTSRVVDILMVRDGTNRVGTAAVPVLNPADIPTDEHVLLIAGGKDPSDSVWHSTDLIARETYKILRSKSLGADRITYLSYRESSDDLDSDPTTDDMDGACSSSGVQAAIANVPTGTTKLVVFIVNHGSDADGGKVRLNENDFLPATDMRAWLDSLQAARPFLDVCLVLDFCFAGAFAETLAPGSGTPHRLALASCQRDQLTYFLSGGTTSFAYAFASALREGHTLEGSFGAARDAMSLYQKPVWLDFGQALASTGLSWASNHVGAVTTPSLSPLDLAEVTPNTLLDGNEEVSLFARINFNSASGSVENVWVEVVPPNFRPEPGSLNPVLGVGRIPLARSVENDLYEVRLSGFSQPGTYAVVHHAENEWGQHATPKISYITQGRVSHLALLVEGDASASEQGGQVLITPKELRSATRLAYQTLLQRGFTPDRIHVFSPTGPRDLDGDGQNDIDHPALLDVLESVLASNRTEQLVLSVVGPGFANGVPLGSGQILTPGRLDLMLDNWTSTTGAVPEVTLLLDFARAGAFVENCAGSNRVVVASCRPGRYSAHAGGLSFQSQFWPRIGEGMPLLDAFRRARVAVRRASGFARQSPLLDDNGNGVPNERRKEGRLAAKRFLGRAFATGDDLPNIAATSGDTRVAPGTPVTLWADGVTSGEALSSVFALLRLPSHTVTDPPLSLPLAQLPGSSRWEAAYQPMLPGEYSVILVASNVLGRTHFAQPFRVWADPALAGDDYEPDPDWSRAAYVNIPASLPRVLAAGPDLDQDWVRFYALTNFVYDIETVHEGEDSTLDTALDLYRLLSNGQTQLVYSVDDFGPETGELIGLDFPTNGFYLVRVRHSPESPALTANYRLNISIPFGVEQGLNVAVVDLVSQQPVVGTHVTTRNTATGQILNRQITSANTKETGGLAVFPLLNGEYELTSADPAFKVYAPLRTEPLRITSADFQTAVIYGSGGVALTFGVTVLEKHPAARLVSRVHNAETRAPLPLADIQVTYATPLNSTEMALFPRALGTTTGGDFPGNAHVKPGVPFTVRVSRPGFADWTGGISQAATNSLNAIPPGIFLQGRDTNGNAIADWWELLHHGPGLPSGPGPLPDKDADGADGYMEYMAGTDPGDADSLLRAAPSAGGAGLTLRWPALPGRRYTVLAAEPPLHATWNTRQVITDPTGPVHEWTDANPSPGRWYRVQCQTLVPLAP